MLQRTTSRANNFGALRLLFAYLVIVAHSPELIDGDVSREPLTRVFGTITFGGLAVDGFFLISGYLITKSFVTSQSSVDYLWKRVLRIYPGYVVAFLISLLIVGPIGGGHVEGIGHVCLMNLKHLALLQSPELPGAFEGSHYPALNGSMWTISYEFRCYLIVLALGVIGGLSKRWAVLAGTALLLVLSTMDLDNMLHRLGSARALIGDLNETTALTGIFGVGACFYLFRDHVRYKAAAATIAAFLFLLMMFSPLLATPGLAIFGGYLLFWFAFAVRSERLRSIGQTVDLSYGVYLYAFPIQKLIILFSPDLSPWTVTAVTIVVASGIAWFSWWLIEKPALDLRGLKTGAIPRWFSHSERAS